MGGAYYNEHDTFAAAWLRELIKNGLIADGEVDERDIQQVTAADVRGFTQCHFFAGIGGWSYALRLAGWPDDRPVWTGSCPCQPFSQAGRGDGETDQRHLWPVWFQIIRECRPSSVFGEQIASKAGREWFDLVCDDLESAGYAVAPANLPAACAGAPHERARLWFIADAIRERSAVGTARQMCARGISNGHRIDSSPQHERHVIESWYRGIDQISDADADSGRRGQFDVAAVTAPTRQRARLVDEAGLFWRTQPRPVAVGDGLPARVGRLRGYGNAIVPQVAAQFIQAYLETTQE